MKHMCDYCQLIKDGESHMFFVCAIWWYQRALLEREYNTLGTSISPDNTVNYCCKMKLTGTLLTILYCTFFKWRKQKLDSEQDLSLSIATMVLVRNKSFLGVHKEFSHLWTKKAATTTAVTTTTTTAPATAVTTTEFSESYNSKHIFANKRMNFKKILFEQSLIKSYIKND